MTPHRIMMDDLQSRIVSPGFREMPGVGDSLAIARPDPDRLTVTVASSLPGWQVDVAPLDPSRAPDARPRLVMSSTAGGADYADHSVDGLVMGLVSMLIQARHGDA